MATATMLAASPSPALIASPAEPAGAATPAPSSSPTPATSILYTADFRTWFTGEEGGQYPLRASVDPITGEYHLALTAPQGGYVNYRTAPEDPTFRDFRLDIDLRRVEGPEQGFYGVVFRVQPPVPGARMIERYFLAISGDGYLTFNHIGADGTVVRVAPRTEVPAIAKGELVNHLTVVCIGTEFTVVINGQTVGTYAGPANAGGSVGVTLGTVPSSVQPNSIGVIFSNFVLSSVP